MNRDQAQLWALRLLWFLAPLAAGSQLRGSLDGVGTPGRWLIEGALWLGWFVGAVATLTPHPVSLTIIRCLAPTVAGTGMLFAVSVGWTRGLAVTVGYGALLTAISLLPTVGDVMVNGSAYGSERRMALRTPAVAYLGPIPIAWFMVFAGLTGWAPAFNAVHPVAGVAAAIVGAVAVWFGGRLLHQLARRWIVFVPAGFVVHDPFQLAEPVLLPRGSISRLGPAEVGSDADGLDLSAGSLGLALEAETGEPITFGVLRNRNVQTTKAKKLVFSPSLPGALLSEARIRGIKIKGSSGTD
ncbi:MAG: hypothetical protein OEW83_05280 [Acidimicrobiia bacterium]|nr:hypothetical protein [Acidimicrobiia bacterium]